MSRFSPIHHVFGPLASFRQFAMALSVPPWRWRTGRAHDELRRELAQRFKGDVFLFASGREALLALLRSLTLKRDEEVIVQGYTCVVVPNAIQAAGCRPVFADIDPDTLNLHPPEAEAALTPLTRAVICQHTFGMPADTAALRDLCDRHSLLLIEDCAHVMPDDAGPAEIGAHGDFLFYSFGRDKAISGVTGGAIISRHKDVSALLGKEEAKAAHLPWFTVLRLILYPLLYSVARPLYGIGVGKGLLAAASKLSLLLPIVTLEEKKGRMHTTLHRMPNVCAAMALAQLNGLKEINDHRRRITSIYLEEGTKRGWLGETDDGPVMPAGINASLPLQKFPVFVRGADGIRAQLKHRNIHLDDGWTNCVICPSSVALSDTQYIPGSDPQAEEACHRILSLPTHPGTTEEQARELLAALDDITGSSAS